MKKSDLKKEETGYIRTLFLNQSLGLKIIFFIGVLLIIAILVSFYINNEAHNKELINLTQLQAHRLADTIKNTIRHYMINQAGNRNVQSLIETIGNREDIFKISIINKGEIKFSSWREDVGKICSKEEKICTLCHFPKEDQPPLSIFIHNIYKNNKGNRFIEVFNPIQNEPICYFYKYYV